MIEVCNGFRNLRFVKHLSIYIIKKVFKNNNFNFLNIKNIFLDYFEMIQYRFINNTRKTNIIYNNYKVNYINDVSTFLFFLF